MENVAQYINSFISIVTGLLICVPLVVQFVKVCKQMVVNKQWTEIVTLAAELMMQAENSIDSGSERLSWVMGMLKQSAVTAKYDLNDEDWYKIEKMIRSMCDMAKVVNATIVMK